MGQMDPKPSPKSEKEAKRHERDRVSEKCAAGIERSTE